MAFFPKTCLKNTFRSNLKALLRNSTLGHRSFSNSPYRNGTSSSIRPRIPATLHLKTGEKFTGTSFGAPVSRFGETVFTTSITSYPESLTDPSYLSQILVFTTPLIGNYGVPANDIVDGIPTLESDGVKVAGVIVADLAEKYSHYLAVESLHQWCERYGVPGITGVDTREITKILREQGTTLGKIAVGEGHLASVPIDQYWDPSKENLVDQVSTKEAYVLNPKGDVKIALIDFGAKANIARSLVRRGACVTVFPWNTDFYSIRDQFDGLFLSNGPGDPKHCWSAAENLKKTIQNWNKPIFGICMGNQIVGMAAGLEVERMRFGNRGHNQPVLCTAESRSIKRGRVLVTSQNHQYALKLQDPFPKGWELFFLNANDASVEGIKSTSESGVRCWAAQFHPEAYGGPLDAMSLFDDYIYEVRAVKAAS